MIKEILDSNKTQLPSTVSVEQVDGSIKSLITDMFDSMYAHEGIGLAANQIGSDKKVIVIDNHGSFTGVLINPIILLSTGISIAEEGCLSCPGVSKLINRPTDITVEYIDIEGKKQLKSFFGLVARVIQHEIDHLNGILITDK